MIAAMIDAIITTLKMKLLIIPIADMNAMCVAVTDASLGQTFDTFFQLRNANPPELTLNASATPKTK